MGLSLGLSIILAPHGSVITRRYGFYKYDALTKYTVALTQKKEAANATEHPFFPAPASVVSCGPLPRH